MRDNLIIKVGEGWSGDMFGVRTQHDGRYIPARPEGFASIWYRIRATWLVWTGRADALIWPGNQ